MFFPSLTCDDLRLSVDDFFCGACLTFLQLLPDAGDHSQVTLQSVSHLRTNQTQIFTCTCTPEARRCDSKTLRHSAGEPVHLAKRAELNVSNNSPQSQTDLYVLVAAPVNILVLACLCLFKPITINQRRG